MLFPELGADILTIGLGDLFAELRRCFTDEPQGKR